MLKLKLMQVNLMSLAKVAGVVNGLIGVVTACFMGLSKVLGIDSPQAAQLQDTPIISIALLPVMYAVFGAISGYVGGFFYNTAVKWVGPLELSMAEKEG